jgi:hypothetical protein
VGVAVAKAKSEKTPVKKTAGRKSALIEPYPRKHLVGLHQEVGTPVKKAVVAAGISEKRFL